MMDKMRKWVVFVDTGKPRRTTIRAPSPTSAAQAVAEILVASGDKGEVRVYTPQGHLVLVAPLMGEFVSP